MDKLKKEPETIKCKCNYKKVNVLTVCSGTQKIKYAPCKNCGAENLISTEPWKRGAAEIDMSDEKEVIQHIRDLFNLSRLLERGLNAELLDFIHQMKAAGYNDERVHKFITAGAHGTIFGECPRKGVENGEEYTLGLVDLERPIPNRGDWKEWLSLRPRAM